MPRIDKTVFVSYRRTNIGYALAIYQNLSSQGYDVFFDYNSIDSGDFEQIILNNIASRAHFVVLLTPSALERLDETGDWLRREIEYAIETKRNIVPLTMEDFDWSIAQKHLTGKLAPLGNYNALRVPADYFMEAMNRLCSRYLNIDIDTVLHPRSTQAQQAAATSKTQADAQPKVQEKELTASEWFEKGYQSTDSDEKIKFYSEAIRLNPNYAEAYNNRGIARDNKGDFGGAIDDYTEAIRLKPDFAKAYYNRGAARKAQGDLHGAIADCTEAIRLKPDYAEAYYNRGAAYWSKGDFPKCVADWEKTLELDPNDEIAKEWLPKARAKL